MLLRKTIVHVWFTLMFSVLALFIGRTLKNNRDKQNGPFIVMGRRHFCGGDKI